MTRLVCTEIYAGCHDNCFNKAHHMPGLGNIEIVHCDRRHVILFTDTALEVHYSKYGATSSNRCGISKCCNNNLFQFHLLMHIIYLLCHNVVLCTLKNMWEYS